jgi:hypothetical protein
MRHITLLLLACCIFTTSKDAIGYAMDKKIRDIHIGLVVEHVEVADGIRVTLDNGISKIIPKTSPVYGSYLSKTISSEPHRMNDGIALVTYENGETVWIHARISVFIWADLMVNKRCLSLSDLLSMHYVEQDYKEQLKKNGEKTDRVRIECLPVPSMYNLYFFSQFFQESYAAIRGAIAEKYDDTYSGAKYRVDIAYEQIKGFGGYTVVLVQKSRFHP